ncbi:MAG: type IX secretion system membrane protein PorP/SprF [Bacteroidales bacterium]|nr:type IX secretion system membrane protein PorP/SprF [Bacteroidales bacterium]
MIRLSILIIFLAISFFVHGQQWLQQNQYFHNEVVINPAVAGAKDCGSFGISVRKQWLGLDQSPLSQTAFFQIELGKKSGIGVVAFNDISGAAKYRGAEFQYSHHVFKTSSSILALGLSAKIQHYRFDETDFMPEIYEDPALTYTEMKNSLVDAAFGAFYRTGAFDIGLGAHNLLSTLAGLDPFDILKRHYFIHSSYEYATKRWILTPSILLKSTENLAFSFDVSVKLLLRKHFLTGLNYRRGDGVDIMLGFEKSKWLMAYSYGLVLSNLRMHNIGSHEIFIGYRFCKESKFNGKRRLVPCAKY